MGYMRDSTGKRLDSFPVQNAGALYRQAALLKGYSIVADLNRPFYASVGEPADVGISNMTKKRHIAVCDATDLVVLYANWKGASDTTNGPGNVPLYVRSGFAHIADGDIFPATFAGGTLSEATIQPGRIIGTDPIAGSKITAGTAFYLGTYVRVDQVLATVTTATGSNSLTAATITSGGPFYVGQYIYGTGIPAGATITAISGTTLTISANATATGTAVAVNAYGSWGQHAIGYNTDGDIMNNSGAGAAQTAQTDRTGDMTLLSWGAVNTHVGYGAAVILGRTAPSRPVRAIAARVDSIGTGAFDNIPVTSTSGSGDPQPRGWVERTFAGDGVMLVGHGGLKKSVITTPPSTQAVGYRQAHAQRLMAGSTGVIFEDGTNDVANYNGTTSTVATLQATFIKDWRKGVGERGLPGWQATMLPRVASSADNFISDASQVATSYETARLQINAWLRDGAPVNADLSPAAVGATGAGVSRCPYLSWNGTAWVATTGAASTSLHPLALGGVFEVADAVETARNSGLWARQWEGTGTLTSGSTAVASVVTTAGSFLATPPLTPVVGTGIPFSLSAPASGALASGTLTLSAAANASGTAVKLGQPYTIDGTHPVPAGHLRIAAWLNQTGTDGRSARTILRDSCNA